MMPATIILVIEDKQRMVALSRMGQEAGYSLIHIKNRQRLMNSLSPERLATNPWVVLELPEEPSSARDTLLSYRKGFPRTPTFVMGYFDDASFQELKSQFLIDGYMHVQSSPSQIWQKIVCTFAPSPLKANDEDDLPIIISANDPAPSMLSMQQCLVELSDYFLSRVVHTVDSNFSSELPLSLNQTWGHDPSWLEFFPNPSTNPLGVHLMNASVNTLNPTRQQLVEALKHNFSNTQHTFHEIGYVNIISTVGVIVRKGTFLMRVHSEEGSYQVYFRSGRLCDIKSDRGIKGFSAWLAEYQSLLPLSLRGISPHQLIQEKWLESFILNPDYISLKEWINLYRAYQLELWRRLFYIRQGRVQISLQKTPSEMVDLDLGYGPSLYIEQLRHRMFSQWVRDSFSWDNVLVNIHIPDDLFKCLTDEDLMILRAADLNRSVREILTISNSDPDYALPLLYALVCLGYVEVADQPVQCTQVARIQLVKKKLHELSGYRA